MAGKRVLVVDDDVKTTELVKLYLRRDGYKVFTAYDGIQAINLAREAHPDLVVLDLMLPGLDGFEVFRALRAKSDVPVIMLTAKTTEQDRLAGLDLGADDYVTKPFSPKELAARVRAVLRRLPDETFNLGPEEIEHGDLLVNFAKHEASVAGRRLNLTPVEFRLLGILVREPDRVFSRAQLIEKVFGYDFDGFNNDFDVFGIGKRKGNWYDGAIDCNDHKDISTYYWQTCSIYHYWNDCCNCCSECCSFWFWCSYKREHSFAIVFMFYLFDDHIRFGIVYFYDFAESATSNDDICFLCDVADGLSFWFCFSHREYAKSYSIYYLHYSPPLRLRNNQRFVSKRRRHCTAMGPSIDDVFDWCFYFGYECITV